LGPVEKDETLGLVKLTLTDVRRQQTGGGRGRVVVNEKKGPTRKPHITKEYIALR